MLVVFWLCLDQMKVHVFAQRWKHFSLLDYFFCVSLFQKCLIFGLEADLVGVGGCRVSPVVLTSVVFLC